MKCTATSLAGVWVIQPDRHVDVRGWFARAWSHKDAAAHGMDVTWVESNLSFNKHKGTLRGLHCQNAPHAQAKLVTCMTGKIYDVAVDLRPDSPTHLKHVAVELDAALGNSLFIPKGLAHGFLTLTDDVLVHYEMDAYFEPAAGRGVRFDDPKLGVKWPLDNPLVAERDRTFAWL